ncbi:MULTISPECIES: hypothetical protein [unclassified Paenibacillus]|uniref:hypothetical protein n=1 Tax=unclassified Paenibacillus TaxID=185978 RepID=UPI00020D6E02|nr:MULTISPECIES: hypothetical protein [unclassified Paenibacillus]EGL15228.1 hypothetical protein HMPREF9413_2928 [Paenibacillus sp. HGF7]EPD88890.1 hypothetical protein HMPREF1207_01841 [Paenibacillus sp. HGH0039]
MITFLQTKGIKAYNEILEIAERPDFLFSNDRDQVDAEARYNHRTIQRLNKMIKYNKLSLNELEDVVAFVESAWASYLKKFYEEKAFVFYMWGDYQIPAIRISVVSYYEGLGLPFGCIVNQVDDRKEVLIQYREKACFDGIPIRDSEDPNSVIDDEEENTYLLTVYARIING